MDENVWGLGAIGGDGAVEVVDAAPAVGTSVGDDLDEFVRSKLGDASEGAIVVGEEVPFGAEDVVGGAEG